MKIYVTYTVMAKKKFSLQLYAEIFCPYYSLKITDFLKKFCLDTKQSKNCTLFSYEKVKSTNFQFYVHEPSADF